MNDPIENSQLKSIVERIERLEEEKKTIADDIKEVYAEAKGNGYDVKVLRKLIALRKRDVEERAEEEAILELYEQALGDLADTPLGRAAAPGFASRAPIARSAETRSERVSHATQRQNPSEGEVGSAVRAGAPVSETADPGRQPSVQNEAEAGASPEQGSAARAGREGEGIAPAHAGQFVTPTTAAFTRKPYVLRPHCQRPQMCGSYGSKHCGACERAAKETEDDDSADVPAFVRKTHHHAVGDQA